MILARSSSAPEYDKFKQLFRCHATKSDYYIVYPNATRIERVCERIQSNEE